MSTSDNILSIEDAVVKAMDKETQYIYKGIVGLYRENFIERFPRIANHISDFINKRSDVLQTKNCGKHLYYTKATENELFEAAGVDRSQIVKIVSEAPTIPYKYNDEKEPIYNFLMILSCFYEIHQKELEELYGTKVIAHKFVRFYLGLRIYSICQRYIFHYDVNENIMEYTVAHMNSRFDIVKVDNLYQLIEQYVETNNSSYNIDFKNIQDLDIYKYISYMIHRFRSMLKNVFREFMKNYEAGNTIQTEEIQLTGDEGKKYFAVTTSVSNTIDVHSKKIMQNFIQDYEVNRKLVEIACKRCGNISVQKTTMILNNIRKSDDKSLLMDIIKDIISYWLISLKHPIDTIHSIEFIKKCSSAYSISNTYDIFISDLKEKLNTLMLKYSADYIDTEKRSTLNSFKQAVFLYLVFYISSLN